MNLRLQDHFAEVPEYVEEVLDEGHAVTARFNRWGTLLACGCHDGRVVVWDFVTLSVARFLVAHAVPGRARGAGHVRQLLATASTDRTVVVWDVLAGAAVARERFESPIWTAQFHPRDPCRILVCPTAEPPCVLSLPALSNRSLGPALAGNFTRIPLPVPFDLPPQPQAVAAAAPAAAAKQLAMPSSAIAAVFDRKGTRILAGNSRCALFIVECPPPPAEMRLVRTERLPAPVKAIEVSRNGKYFLVNSTDRVIRSFDAATLAPIAEFKDEVNRVPWRKCTWSSNSDYIVSGSAAEPHDLYIWSREGNILKIVKGPQSERVLDLVWHPVRPRIVSCASNGCVYLWATFQTENWSAYAPTFKELEENEEHVEREDEFDFPEDETATKKKKAGCGAESGVVEEDAAIDIVTEDPIAAYQSGSEDEHEDESANLMFLPAVPERDVVVLPPPLPSQPQQPPPPPLPLPSPVAATASQPQPFSTPTEPPVQLPSIVQLMQMSSLQPVPQPGH